MELIIGLIAGAVGGNVAGGIFRKLNMGMLVNSVAGIIGGGLGTQALDMLGAGSMTQGGVDLTGVLGQVATGGVGGGALLALVGLIRNATSR